MKMVGEQSIGQSSAFAVLDSQYKSWRLIVRNLPFKTTQEDLQTVFGNFGPLSEIVLPKCKDKRFPNSCAGFAFIQFRKRQNAMEAIEKLNMSEVLGRKIAVDYALSKDTYETVVHEEKQKNEEIKKEIKQEVESNDGSIIEKEGRDDSEIKEEVVSEGLSDEDSYKIEKKSEKQAAQEFKEDKAVLEGRVVFIRNLSYETTDKELKEALSKFGNISLAVLCYYAGSEHPKGTAFVHFETADGAEKCLSAIDQAPGILIGGRRIFGHQALPRSEAARIEKEKLSKKPKDKRNLFLLRAGFIRPGSTAAAGMSEADAEKRARMAVVARKKLKNLHMFVSPTRLVVHNLPKPLTDKAFRSMCFIAAGNPDAKITECRIWRDRNKLGTSGEAVSRGFGFVNFLNHEDALSAMKHLNNNPDIFTKEKRPIVEFSIENLVALRLRESRLKKSQQNQKGNEQVICDKNKLDLEQTKKHLSAGGQKPLPSYLGPKIRKRDANMKKAQVKQKIGKKRKLQVRMSGTVLKKRKTNHIAEATPKKKKTSRSKQLTKYLTLSG
ncbi:RNA-binding protein, putative [Brugia malayi]|nr:RNA-binding protein, putative [Brugia malayi]VIO93281.1 RNA-binding protein, putative [Brugia malayi]